MQIFIGSDHGGFEMKQFLLDYLQRNNYLVTDCGSYNSEATDYPDFAMAVARAVQGNPISKGILICKSGEGMEIAANKVNGIRAALVWNADVAVETRRDNDANILVLPADFISMEVVPTIVCNFLKTEFSGFDRHIRRLEKITAIEKSQHEG